MGRHLVHRTGPRPTPIDNYRSLLRCHILLRWGSIPLPAITTLSINRWITDLRQLGYANTTIIKLLSMILTDTADEGLIPANPAHSRRRHSRRSHRIPPKKVWATPTEVLRIADQATALSGRPQACSSSPPPGPDAAEAN
jgi:hypothetical protein